MIFFFKDELIGCIGDFLILLLFMEFFVVLFDKGLIV